MQCVTAVEGNWLAEVGDKFFSINEGGASRQQRRRCAVEHKQAMEAEMARAQQSMKEKEEEKIRLLQSARRQQVYDMGTPRHRMRQSASERKSSSERAPSSQNMLSERSTKSSKSLPASLVTPRHTAYQGEDDDDE